MEESFCVNERERRRKEESHSNTRAVYSPRRAYRKFTIERKKKRNRRKKPLNREILYDDPAFNLQVVKRLLRAVETSSALGVETSADSFSFSTKTTEKVPKKKSNDLSEYLKDANILVSFKKHAGDHKRISGKADRKTEKRCSRLALIL